VVGIAVALFGASGVFGQLQDALNIILGVKPKPLFLGALVPTLIAGAAFMLLP
jgi:hypothetical protein